MQRMTIAMRLGRRYSGTVSFEKTIFIMKCTAVVTAIPSINIQITEIKNGGAGKKAAQALHHDTQSYTTRSANNEV